MEDALLGHAASNLMTTPSSGPQLYCLPSPSEVIPAPHIYIPGTCRSLSWVGAS